MSHVFNICHQTCYIRDYSSTSTLNNKHANEVYIYIYYNYDL